MSKKILSVVLALVFILSTFAVSAFAIEGTRGEYEADKELYHQTWALENDGDEDGDGLWKVSVKLTTDYKVGAIQFVVNNPNDNVKLTDVALVVDNDNGITEDYGAVIDANKDTGKVVIVPYPVNGAEAVVLTDAVIAELTYSVPEGESATLTIDADEAKTDAKPEGTLIALRMADEYLETGDMIYGQNVNADAATTTLGDAAAELVLTSVGTTNGVVIDTHKTFGGKFTGVVYGFKQIANNTFKNQNFLYGSDTLSNLTATNGGSLKITKTSGGFGTGTTVEVLNSDGTSTGKVFVVVIFGDVNGDGLMNATDSGNIYNSISGKYTFVSDSVEALAANCHATNKTLAHRINANDALAVYNHVAGTKIDAAALAKTHNGYNDNYQ